MRSVVLFDFDGTLADTVELIVDSYHAVLPTPMTDAQIRALIGRPLSDTFEERYPGRGEELTEKYRMWNLAHHDELIKSVVGVRELLGELRMAGRPLAIVSSKFAKTVRLGTRAVGIDDLIDLVVGKEHTAVHKPAPEPLLAGAALLGVEPAECVYVGDAIVDIQAAKAARMASIGVTWGAGLADALAAEAPDALVDDVAGLRQALALPG